jgi:hypothetical protein
MKLITHTLNDLVKSRARAGRAIIATGPNISNDSVKTNEKYRNAKLRMSTEYFNKEWHLFLSANRIITL